eukprot:38183-Chlamydomonas_euryale.AAC.4
MGCGCVGYMHRERVARLRGGGALREEEGREAGTWGTGAVFDALACGEEVGGKVASAYSMDWLCVRSNLWWGVG